MECLVKLSWFVKEYNKAGVRIGPCIDVGNLR